LLELLQAFTSRCSQIDEAIRVGDDARVATLDCGIEPLVQAILDHNAANLLEMYMQLQFVAHLLQQEVDDGTSISNHAAVLTSLLNRYFGAPPRRDLVFPRQFPLASPKPYIPNIDNGNFLNSAILETLPDRVAVLTRDYRYLYSNAVNCAHLGRKPIDMIGRHVMEFIGEERFLTRAKVNLDACFAGQHVDCYYVQHNGSRSMRCRMSPLRDLSGQVLGALIVLETANAAAVSSIAA
jgi:PAS domain-containing protein